jgi:hypothetical protein
VTAVRRRSLSGYRERYGEQGEIDVDRRAGETANGKGHDVLESSVLSALLPPIPEWPDLN